MKLNYKRTLLCGFAFFGITAFWQLYDNIISLILKFDFNMAEKTAGWIMSLDNIFALFMLPLFGALSDRTTTRFGKRMPYILFGTVMAAIAFTLLPIAAEANQLVLFIVLLLCSLLAMSVYRSPAVSLMPDITPKPLRSKANAIINLMGTMGGLAVLVCVSMFMKTTYFAVCENGIKTPISGTSIARFWCEDCGLEHLLSDATVALEHESFFLLFAITAGIMLVCLAILLGFVKENRFVKDREKIEAEYGLNDDAVIDTAAPTERLRPEVRKSLIFLLFSVAFWYMAYNAVTTAFSKYVITYWNLPDGGFANCLMVAMAAAAVSYIPIGIVSSKI